MGSKILVDGSIMEFVGKPKKKKVKRLRKESNLTKIANPQNDPFSSRIKVFS